MLSADEQFRMAEFALSTRSDMKHRGISWTLLDHVSRYAASRGIEKLHAIHCSRDYGATALERQAGFKVRASNDDPSLLVAEKVLAPDGAWSG
jgi:acetyltransferase